MYKLMCVAMDIMLYNNIEKGQWKVINPGHRTRDPTEETNRQSIHAIIGLQWKYSCEMKTIFYYVNPLQKQIFVNVFRHQLDIMTKFKSGSVL